MIYLLRLLAVVLLVHWLPIEVKPKTISPATRVAPDRNSFHFVKTADTINGASFGIVADYNGRLGTDNRVALQQAVNFCSLNRKVLKLPAGKMLLNSYGLSPGALAHGNIIDLKSNLIIVGNKSEIVVGSFFHDRAFIVFSGLNAVDGFNFSEMRNIVIKNLVINFNASKSYMQTAYLLRKGIELGHTIKGEIANCTFYNGDISCAVSTGFGSRNISRNINIHDNMFQNLIFSKENIDHTSVYLNSSHSTIHHNQFENSSVQAKLVACAAELHNSDTNFEFNKVKGYTRMMFLVTTSNEQQHIYNLRITNNEAKITNAAIYFWLDKSTRMDSIWIANNTIECAHVIGFSMLYNGTQGLLADARNEANTNINQMVVSNNKSTIEFSVFKGRAVNYATKYKFKSINNICIGCKDGLNYQ